MRLSVRPTTAWTTIETTTRETCTSLEHERRARTPVHVFILSHTSFVQYLSLVISSPESSMSASLLCLLFFYFHLSIPVFFFSFHLLHCELYFELGNLIAMESLSYSAKGVKTPTTSLSPSQVMSPTSWLSASSTALRVPSPAFSSHWTRTWMTWNSASCSLRHSEDKPITSNKKTCQSVSRRRLSCSIKQGNLWEKEMSISQLVLVSRETRTVLKASFLKTPKLRKWSTEQWNLREKAVQMHRLGPCLMNRDKWLSKNTARKVGHHELQATHAEEERRIQREEIWWQQLEFREVRQQSFTEMEELRKFQSSTLDMIEDESSSRAKTLFWNDQAEY